MDPVEPMDRIDPTDPMDRIDPADAKDSNDADENIDPKDNTDIRDRHDITDVVSAHPADALSHPPEAQSPFSSPLTSSASRTAPSVLAPKASSYMTSDAGNSRPSPALAPRNLA